MQPVSLECVFGIFVIMCNVRTMMCIQMLLTTETNANGCTTLVKVLTF